LCVAADIEQELPNKKRTSLSDMPSTSAKLPKFHDETISDQVEPSYDGTNASALVCIFFIVTWMA